MQDMSRDRSPDGAKRGGWRRLPLLALAAMALIAGIALAVPLPAQAQFWFPFGGSPRRPPASIPQQQQQYNPFGGFFEEQPRREAPIDYSHAPSPPPRHTDVAPTTPIVVLGDAMADWLAYGLEDAFSDRPEIAIVRKPRAGSGLIRYDNRRDSTDWAQVAREIIAAEKPKFIVMMIGTNDHQLIRERAPIGKPNAPAAKSGTAAQTPPNPGPDAAALAAEEAPPTDQSDTPPTADTGRAAGPSGPFDFHTGEWETAYIKRIDATIAAMKSAGVPVIWVGLPAQRGPRATADASYLNDLYRARAEKAGIIYADIWDGFVDEQGRYSAQGPDFEGQIRRLRSGDGVYFTKAGARKLAHYAEREIDRAIADRAVPVALPSNVELSAPGTRPGASARPLAGPLLPLTVSTTTGGDELLGGARPAARPVSVDPLAVRVLTKGEAIAAPAGRADDFSWPHGSGNAATLASDPSPPAGTVSKTVPNPPAAPAPAPPGPPAKTTKPAANGGATAGVRADADTPEDKPKPPPKRRPETPPANPFASLFR